MKFNKKNPKLPLNQVRDECANYNVGYICDGVWIGSRGEMWIDEELKGKCLMKQGKKCPYFEAIVKPIIGE